MDEIKMSEIPLKRRIVDEVRKEIFEEKVNTLSDAGYTMEHFAFNAAHADNSYEYSDRFIAVMKVKESAEINMKGLLDIMDIPIDKAQEGRAFGSPLVEKAIKEGWEATQLYSGKITCVKRK